MREPGIGVWILAETATCWFEMQHVLQGNQGNQGRWAKSAWGEMSKRMALQERIQSYPVYG